MAKKRTIVVVGSVTFVLLAVLALLRSGAVQSVGVEPEARAAAGAALPLPPGKTPVPVIAARPGNAAAVSAAEEVPHALLQGVKLDKQVACQNEPVTVSVEPQPDVDPATVWVSVDGIRGGTTSVVSYAVPGERRITVVAHDGSEHIDRYEVALLVRECPDDEDRLLIESVPAYQTGTAGFTVRLAPRRRRPGEQVRKPAFTEYRWDFGDGMAKVTHAPYVEHDYSSRDQSAIQSSFVVSVEATGPNDRLIAKTSIALANAYAINRERGILVPPVHYVADAAAEQRDATWTTTAVVTNPESSPLPLDRVQVEFIPCAEEGAGASIEQTPEDVLGIRALPPGPTEVKLRLSRAVVPPGTCRALVTAMGAAGSHLVQLEAAMVLRPPNGSALDASTPQGQELLARLKKAAQVLGRDPRNARITDAELQELSRSGKL